VVVGEVVGEEEEGILLVQFVEAGEVDGEDVEVVAVLFEDRGCEGKGLFETALCEEEFCFGEEDVGIGGEVVMSREGFCGCGELFGVFVFRQSRGVEHPRKVCCFLRRGAVVGGYGVEI